MSEVLENVEVKVEPVNPFAGNVWSENQPEPKKEDVVSADGVVTPPPIQTDAVKTEEIKVPLEWLKKEFDVEDPQVLKTEREEYRKLKDTPPTKEEIKFLNEQSKHIHELLREGKVDDVIEVFSNQKKIEKAVTSEVNKDTAADIIKLSMQLRYKDLTPSEIEYKFNKEFSIPRMPVQSDGEDDEVFAERKETWQLQVNDIETNKIIEAKLAKPELEKLKSQIVLPEINKTEVKSQEPSQESLDAIKKVRENFLQSLESNYSKVEGFSTKVKDESVELPIVFKIPDEDKVAIKGRLSEGMDVNEYMDKRWFDEKGNPRIESIMKDIYQLENFEKILSGVANNAANDRLTHFKRSVKNIDLNGNANQETFKPDENGKKVSPFAKDAWSDKPTITQN